MSWFSRGINGANNSTKLLFQGDFEGSFDHAQRLGSPWNNNTYGAKAGGAGSAWPATITYTPVELANANAFGPAVYNPVFDPLAAPQQQHSYGAPMQPGFMTTPGQGNVMVPAYNAMPAQGLLGGPNFGARPALPPAAYGGMGMPQPAQQAPQWRGGLLGSWAMPGAYAPPGGVK